MINIVLPKADYTKKEIIWEALMDDRRYEPDPLTLLEMRKKIDLEHFQNEVSQLQFRLTFLKVSKPNGGLISLSLQSKKLFCVFISALETKKNHT